MASEGGFHDRERLGKQKKVNILVPWEDRRGEGVWPVGEGEVEGGRK